jgi:hypothetical protein
MGGSTTTLTVAGSELVGSVTFSASAGDDIQLRVVGALGLTVTAANVSVDELTSS